MAKDHHDPYAPSRIPRLLPPEQRHRRSSSAPTRFEVLARNYKNRIQVEQEEKLSAIRGRSRKRDIRIRVQQRGSSHATALRQADPPLQTQVYAAPDDHITSQQTGGYRKPPLPGYTKRSAGRDKGNPLPPLGHNANVRRNSGHRSPPSRGGSANSMVNGVSHSPKPPAAPFLNRPKMARPHRLNSRGSEVESGTDSDINMNHINKGSLNPVERAKLHKIRQREQARLNNAESSDDGLRNHKVNINQYTAKRVPASTMVDEMDERGMSDFQKWQKEQDRERSARLRAHHNSQKNGSATSGSRSGSGSRKEFGHTYTLPSDEESTSSVTNRTTPKSQGRPPTKSPASGRPPQKATHVASRQALIKAQKLQMLNRQRTRSGTLQSSSEDLDEDSGDEEEDKEAQKRQQELEALIAKQEEELERMQRERQMDNEKEKKRAEKQRKRKSAQLERQRVLMEAEEQERLTRQEEHRSRHPSSTTPDVNNSSRRASNQDSRQGRRRRSSVRALNSPVLPPKKAVGKAPTPELNENTAYYYEVAAAEEASAGNLQLAECHTCGRKFASDRLAKHAKVCKSNSKKKPRKVFDPVKMRTKGTEQAQYIDSASTAKPQPKPKKKNWRAQHEDFISTIRYAKKVQEAQDRGENLAALPPPPATTNPDYVPCPHCKRRFNPSTAERHIPLCQNIKARPAPPKAKNKRY